MVLGHDDCQIHTKYPAMKNCRYTKKKKKQEAHGPHRSRNSSSQ